MDLNNLHTPGRFRMRQHSIHAVQVLNGFHYITEGNDEDLMSSDDSGVEDSDDGISDDSGYHTNHENLDKSAYNVLGRLTNMVIIRVCPRYLNTCDCKNRYRTVMN